MPVHVIHILTLTNLEQSIDTLHSPTFITCGVCLSFDGMRNNLAEPGLPQLYFDQLRVIQHSNASLCQPSQAYAVTPLKHCLTRKSLSTNIDWILWLASEFENLNQYDKQVSIFKNLQGHPEGPCENVNFLIKVDDFAIATSDETFYTSICDFLDATFLVPRKLKSFGTLCFGLDIVQARHLMSVHFGSFVCMPLTMYEWADMNPVHFPKASNNTYLYSLDSVVSPSTTDKCEALEAAYFCYCCALGTLI